MKKTDSAAFGLQVFLFLFVVAAAIFHIPTVALATDTVLPSTPANLTATPVPPSQINISWAASSDNVGVAGYYIYRNGVLLTAIGQTSYSDGGLAPGRYTYTVAAYDAAGNVSRQSTATGASLILDTTPPLPPTGVSATANPSSTISQAQVIISWTASTDDVGVAGYSIYRNGALVTTSTLIAATTYTDTVSPGAYAYTVTASDASKNVSVPSAPAHITIILDTGIPTPPGALSAHAVSGSQIDLSWTPATDDVGIAGYYVYRNGTQIATVSTLSYSDAGLSEGNYIYTVTAYDPAGNVSKQSLPASAPIIADLVPPSIPTGLYATAGSSTVALSWRSAEDNVHVSGYYVYRDGVQIANVSSTSYTNSGLSAGTYTYEVTAYDLSGNISARSFPARATIVVYTENPANTASVVAASTNPATTSPLPAASQPSAPNAFQYQFTASLYFGTRNDDVRALQTLLQEKNYLGADDRTGFFGMHTEDAVKKFQCDHNVVCEGSAADTGWGVVGTKTRGVLNALPSSGPTTQTIPSTTTNLDTLQAQLLNLQTQLRALMDASRLSAP